MNKNTKEVLLTEEDIHKMLQIDILTGQKKKDNILPCRKRLGEKTAEKMYKNLDSYLEVDKELRERYDFNATLIDLNKIPEDIVEEITEMVEKKQDEKHFSITDVIKFCRKYKLKAVLEESNLLNI